MRDSAGWRTGCSRNCIARASPDRPSTGGRACRSRAAEPGRVTVALELAEHQLNIQGLAHGGVLATLADAAMGLSVRSALEPGPPARDGRDGRALPPAGHEGTGRSPPGAPLRIGRELAYAEADVRDAASDRMLARAQRHLQRHARGRLAG